MTDTKFVLKANKADLSLGILEGDNLVAEKATTAEPGDIVIALIDGEATVRRFEPWMKVMGRVLEVARRIA
jgi:SOS-response transcriptional repressor LexA